MAKKLHTILITIVCTIVCIAIYDKFKAKQIQRIDYDIAKLVAHKDQNSDNVIKTKSHFYENLDFTEPALMARKAVVSIEAITIKRNSTNNEKFSRSNGSGVIISSNGFIVTNFHVIEDATEITLTLEDRREFSCEIIGQDRSTDLALLKIDANDLDYLTFGNSDKLQIGEWVLAVGNPFKLSASVTAGIVSAKARDINIFKKQGLESFIQTDAAINPGNSGGALIDTNGALVGINTAILTYSGKYEGFSFAIPGNLVNKIVTDLREYGAVQRAWLGVSILDLNKERMKALRLSNMSGVFIDIVEKDGAASDAGIRYEDVIKAIDNKEVKDKPEFLEAMAIHRPGDSVKLKIIRDGREISKTVILRNQRNTTDYIAVRKDKIFSDLGIEVRDLDTKEKKSTYKENGVMVVSVKKGSTLADVNMEPGYIITSLNNQEIQNVNSLKTSLESEKGLLVLKGYYGRFPNEWTYKFYN